MLYSLPKSRMPLKREPQRNYVFLLPYKKLKPNTGYFLPKKKNLKKSLIRPSKNTIFYKVTGRKKKQKLRIMLKNSPLNSLLKTPLQSSNY